MSYWGPNSQNYETGVNIDVNRFLNEFRVQNIRICLTTLNVSITYPNVVLLPFGSTYFVILIYAMFCSDLLVRLRPGWIVQLAYASFA